MLPLVAGQRHQLLVLGQRLGGDPDFSNLVNQHAGHLSGRALVHADIVRGESLAQPGHRLRQHVARLGVGGGNRQGAAVLCGKLLTDTPQIAHFAHDQRDASDHMLAWLGDALEPLAVAGKDFYAKFFFEFDDGLGDAGLRSVQRLGCFGQVQVAANGLLNKAKLV